MATWNGTPGAGCARVSYAVALLLRRSAPSRGSRAAWLAIEAVRRRRKSTILLQLLEYGSLVTTERDAQALLLEIAYRRRTSALKNYDVELFFLHLAA